MFEFIVRLILMFLMYGGVSTTVEAPPARLETAAQPSTAAAASALLEALHFAPTTTEAFAFTDWSQLKTALDASSLTSASSMAERIDFLLPATRDLGAASGFALQFLEKQADLWGWDTTDLLWEATISAGPPVYVLKLRDDFDVDALITRFEERGFDQRKQGDALIFTHPLDLSVDWRTELAVFNAAIFPEHRLLIHASSPAAVETAVATFADPVQSWAADPTYQALAAPLADVASVLIGPGAMLCMPFDAAGLPVDTLGADEQALAETLTRGVGLHPFAALAVGYTLAEQTTEGVILFQYASPVTAQGDLAVRRFLAERGLSLITQAPLSKVLFTVEDAVVTGSTVVLSVAPREGVARRLFDMVNRRDMIFAACP
jgi:hypothetical protein